VTSKHHPNSCPACGHTHKRQRLDGKKTLVCMRCGALHRLKGVDTASYPPLPKKSVNVEPATVQPTIVVDMPVRAGPCRRLWNWMVGR